MPFTISQVDAWRAARTEDQNLEFKEAKTQFDNSKLYKYCVALANEGGGHLLLGIADKAPRPVVGTAAFNDPVEMAAKMFQVLGFRVDLEEVLHPDGRVLVFSIPGRPRGTAYQYEGAYWMRAGEELTGMSEDRLRAIFAEGQPEFVMQAAKSGLGEEEVVTLLDVQSYYDLRKRPLPSTRKEVLEVFASKGFLTKEGGTHAITNMGALLFAKRLGEFPTVGRKGVRVIAYDGVSKLKVKDGKDVTGQKGYAAGFEALIDFIYDLLPASEEIAAALRTTTHAYPKKVIREIVGNAIVHQDLTERGTGITVEIYDDRIEVTNPGLPILPVDRFIDENQSRNEGFADALRQLGICEERGHGMDAVVTEIEAHQLPPYQLRLGTRHTTVVLSRYKQLKDLTPDERIHAVYQHCCLRFVTNQITNNESIRVRFKIEKQNAATASRLLGEAVDAGKIRPNDPDAANKLMRYVPYWA